jgi:hypothetical protein
MALAGDSADRRRCTGARGAVSRVAQFWKLSGPHSGTEGGEPGRVHEAARIFPRSSALLPRLIGVTLTVAR